MPTFLSTDELAKTLNVQAATIRRSFCVKGNYMGMVPHKFPNRRLGWPEEALQRLLNQK